MVGASKFSLQPEELGPKGGQDLLKSLTNQRPSHPPPRGQRPGWSQQPTLGWYWAGVASPQASVCLG